MLRLNERVIKKILESSPDVSLINGNFMRATIKFPHSKKGIQLDVEVSHPALEWASGVRNEVTIISYDSAAMSDGVSYSLCSAIHNRTLPAALLDKIASMRQLALMSNEQADQLNKKLSAGFDRAMDEVVVRA